MKRTGASPGLPKIELAKREPLPLEIARKLVDYLLAGGFEPGQRLPAERQIAEAFGVGRSAIREALKSLTLLGLLEVRHGDGTYLRSAASEFLPRTIAWGLLLGEQQTLDIVEIRSHLEILSARLAAERRDPQVLSRLRESLRRMREAGSDHRAFTEADVEFHLQLSEASHNSALRETLSGIRALLEVWITNALAAAGETASSYLEHVPIFEAVERGDSAAAAIAMEAHMKAAAQRLKNAPARRHGEPEQRPTSEPPHA